MNEVFLMGIFVYSDAGEGGARRAHLSPYAHDETLFLRNCIYMYTHISIYIYIYTSHYMLSENPAVKKYRPFYNNSTIDFYYNTQ